MKELTPEQIQHNWGNLRNIIDVNFSGERLEKLNEMYDYFEERMMLMKLLPAGGKEHYHNCHVGGYVDIYFTSHYFPYRSKTYGRRMVRPLISQKKSWYSLLYTTTWVRLVIWLRIITRYRTILGS